MGMNRHTSWALLADALIHLLLLTVLFALAMRLSQSMGSLKATAQVLLPLVFLLHPWLLLRVRLLRRGALPQLAAFRQYAWGYTVLWLVGLYVSTQVNYSELFLSLRDTAPYESSLLLNSLWLTMMALPLAYVVAFLLRRRPYRGATGAA
jgi:hypothetical protein